MPCIENLKTLLMFEFLKSAFTFESHLNRQEVVLEWLDMQNQKCNVIINKIPIKDLDQWYYDENLGVIRHNSGKFFSIDGIHVKTNWGTPNEWEQPIINQPEIGYLGLITKTFNGVLHFLMQAKIEPGNINCVQLSPTLQATRSNYMQVHRGNKPLYLEYFQNAKSNQILLDQLQSEQGARFLKKRNRNIIIRVEEEIPIYDNFIWLTLGQIKKLIQLDNIVNMDTRTVISGIPFGNLNTEVIDFFNFLNSKSAYNKMCSAFLKSALSSSGAVNTIEEIITFLTKLKGCYDLEISKVPLTQLAEWKYDDCEIRHTTNQFFNVIGVNVEIGNREVINWNQPMIEPAQEGLCAFVCKVIKGILHFCVQAKLEPGNLDIIELAPTVQCLTGNYRHTQKGELPFLDYVQSAAKDKIIFDTLQSEEGGRFYHEQNRNLIILAEDEVPVELPECYIWMTLNQLYTFLKFNNFLNIQARSLISAIPFI